MKLIATDHKTGAHLTLLKDETKINRFTFSRDGTKKYFMIAWNAREDQMILVNGQSYNFRKNTILPLMYNQTFNFDKPAEIVAWQFNREYYCVINHEAEVSCAGFLFGIEDVAFIPLNGPYQYKLKVLLESFIEELNTMDHIQTEILTALLKRLITIMTKLARSMHLPDKVLQKKKTGILRQFNLLVELNFKAEHSVNYYAGVLNKSPKTLSNFFALYHDQSPLQVIQKRIILEAKHLLAYTAKSGKQITYELGFEDHSSFCNFFKRHTGLTPVEFKNEKIQNFAAHSSIISANS
jgi:AraC family transcriptional regulator, transcriptional activator of pobA